jgi:hypothetical protein
MVNPFLEAEIEAAVQQIQKNINQVKDHLSKKPCSRFTAANLLTVASQHDSQDVRRFLKTNSRCHTDQCVITGTGERGSNEYGGYE